MTGMKLTVSNDVINDAIEEKVANDLDLDPALTTVTVLRVTRKKGGGVEAEVAIDSPGKQLASKGQGRGDQ